MRKVMLVLMGCLAAAVAVEFACAQEANPPTPAPAPAAATMLYDFENEDDVKFCEAKADTETAAVAEHATSGKQSLKVTMKGGADWPGLYAEKMPVKDWTGFAALKFDVFAEGDVTLGMTIKDPNSKSFETRYNNDKIQLTKGANTVVITLGDVADAIDIKKIKSISIFCYKPEKDVTLFVDNMRLEK